MMLWIKERNSALPRDGAARAASPPACAACILPPFRNLSRPNRLSVSWLGLRKPKDGIERPCSGTNFRIPVWLMPWSHIRNRSKSSPSKSGFPLIRRRWFAIEARANTSFFLQYRPLSARPRPAGEALPDARIRLSVPGMPQSAPFFPALAICFPACFPPFPPASGVSRLCSRLPGFPLCGTCAEDCFFFRSLPAHET